MIHDMMPGMMGGMGLFALLIVIVLLLAAAALANSCSPETREANHVPFSDGDTCDIRIADQHLLKAIYLKGSVISELVPVPFA